VGTTGCLFACGTALVLSSGFHANAQPMLDDEQTGRSGRPGHVVRRGSAIETSTALLADLAVDELAVDMSRWTPQSPVGLVNRDVTEWHP
jgi:hypothetical protein